MTPPRRRAAGVAANLHNRASTCSKAVPNARAPPARPDNRVLGQDGEQYRYDVHGNLIERLSPDGSRLRLVRQRPRRGRWNALMPAANWLADYQYDRCRGGSTNRLVPTTKANSTHHHLLRLEWRSAKRRRQDDQRQWQLRTTLYEPGSFIPLCIDQTATPNPILLDLKRQLADAVNRCPINSDRP